ETEPTHRSTIRQRSRGRARDWAIRGGWAEEAFRPRGFGKGRRPVRSAAAAVEPRRGILICLALCLAAAAQAEDRPNPREIPKTVRVAQAAQDRTVTGQLRTGGKKGALR